MKNSLFESTIWSEFMALFSTETGVFIQVVDREGRIVSGKTSPPALCALMERYDGSRAACFKEWRRITAGLEKREEIAAFRCYAGLSCRVVPVFVEGEEPAFLVVGKVLTELFGGEQAADIVGRYEIAKESYVAEMKKIRYMSGAELDIIARFLGRLARHLMVMNRKGKENGALRRSQRQVVDFNRKVWSHHHGGRADQLGRYAEHFIESFDVSSAALFIKPKAPDLRGEIAAAGPASGNLEQLLDRGPAVLDEITGPGGVAVILNEGSLRRQGLDPGLAPLMAGRLSVGGRGIGYLLLQGKAAGDYQPDIIYICCQMLASRLTHKEEKHPDLSTEKLPMLNKLSRTLFSAGDVETVLSTAVESAMSVIKARRGSIFLVEKENHRVISSAMRGTHAELAGTIRSLQPSSIAHQVFTDNKPLIVKDVKEEYGRRRKRKFPYTTRSCISAPVRSNGKTLGVFMLSEREGQGAFNPLDLSMLDRLGLEAGAAVRMLQLQEEVERLRELSRIDSLTDVFNRRFLEEYLAAEFERSTRFQHSLSLLMVDIDNFKEYNDILGHKRGDDILAELASSLEEKTRTIDIIARYGGDEFMIVLPETGLKGAISIAEKMRAGIESTRFSSEELVHKKKLTVSIGVVTFPDMAISTDDLIKKADLALMNAKRIGKNMVLPWTGK